MRPLSFAAFYAIAANLALSLPAHSQTAPQGLRGKSIIITWGEFQSVRRPGEANFHNDTVPFIRRVYISATGRPFSRTGVTARGYEGTNDIVGAGGTTFGGGPRQMQFSGRTMTDTGVTKGNLALQITVTFNENFSACEAQVVRAKPIGVEVAVGRNYYTGEPVEIRSSRVSSVTCAVRDSNVFAQ
jgi:hypothetical protein